MIALIDFHPQTNYFIALRGHKDLIFLLFVSIVGQSDFALWIPLIYCMYFLNHGYSLYDCFD